MSNNDMISAEKFIKAMETMANSPIPKRIHPNVGIIKCRDCRQYHVMKSYVEILPVNKECAVDKDSKIECLNNIVDPYAKINEVDKLFAPYSALFLIEGIPDKTMADWANDE